jgi:tetratricopeptide (TPR) repeat protein
LATTAAFHYFGGVCAGDFGTYGLAWWSAYRLTNQYLEDADTSFEEGRYLDALTGYDVYDREREEYVEYGGYMQIRRIWINEYAYPVPAKVEHAEARIDEIVYERLTIEDAEQFVQENIGRTNPYMGMIYLRLGELYEAAGEYRDAEDIYESIPDLFPQDKALQERARQNFINLRQKVFG